MAFGELLLTIARRWYVMVVALVGAALIAMAFIQSQGVYTTRTSITFMYPEATALDRYNGTGDRSVIAFSSAIVQEANHGEPASTYADDAAPYYGAGLRQSVNVSLPNQGNQWVSIYQKAQIDIQIVGPTYQWVEAKQRSIVSQVFTIAEDRQSQLGIAPRDQIVPALVPLTLTISRVAPSRSAVILAIAGLGIAGLLVGGWGAVILERLRSRSRLEKSHSQARSVGNRLLEDSKV